MGMSYLLAPPEIARVERERALGITSREVVRLFEDKGARFSEATFRKYVQAGLLPRSRRVGRKGKHTGSTGLYPVAVDRGRVEALKMLVERGADVRITSKVISFAKLADHERKAGAVRDSVLLAF